MAARICSWLLGSSRFVLTGSDTRRTCFFYVTYAKVNPATLDDVAGPGLGFVDVFSPGGRRLQRLEHGSWLSAPWGVALAPGDFGAFSHHLLVGHALHEAERRAVRVVGEQPPPSPQHQRVDQQEVHVDEAVAHQRLQEFAAAHHDHVLARLLLEPGHCLCGVAGEQRRVLPRQRLPQCPRGHVFLGGVEHRGERVVFASGPDGEEVQVGASPEPQRSRLPCPSPWSPS